MISSDRYTLAPTGRRDAIVEDTGRRVEYSYDALDRLSREKVIDAVFGDRTTDYTYDAVGNRLSASDPYSSTTYTYDDANRLASVDGVPYVYDNNGNLLNNGVTSYTYDAANHMLSAGNAAGAMTYAYNGLGERLRMTFSPAGALFASNGSQSRRYGLMSPSLTRPGPACRRWPAGVVGFANDQREVRS